MSLTKYQSLKLSLEVLELRVSAQCPVADPSARANDARTAVALSLALWACGQNWQV